MVMFSRYNHTNMQIFIRSGTRFSRRIKFFHWLFFALAMLASSKLLAEEAAKQALPEPLTLEYALSLSENDHPDNIVVRAQYDAALAEKNRVTGEFGIQTRVEGRLRWTEPVSSTFDQKSDDHFVALSARKRLFDSGYSQAGIDSAMAGVETKRLTAMDLKLQHKIAITQAFFNVILADLAYSRDNEFMAIAFVRYDRVKDKNKLGQVADVELLEAENTYHAARSVRYASDVKRRASRSRLANILNHPGQLSDTLVRPVLSFHKHKPDDIDTLQKEALKNNFHLLALRKQVESYRKKVKAARARKNPVVDLELQVADYTRVTRATDRYRGGLVFEMPLTSSGAIDAEIAKQRALLVESQARLRKAEFEVQQQVLELWQQIYIIKAQHDEAKIFEEYRDLALDKSRGLYELDIKSDLGDSLALFSAALHKSAKANFDLTMAWIQLDAIRGKPVVIK